MSLKSLAAKARRRERTVRQAKPWKKLRYGQLDSLAKAENTLLGAVRSNPERFRLERGVNQAFVLITTPVPRQNGQHHGWLAEAPRDPIKVWIPFSKVKRMGLAHLIISAQNGQNHNHDGGGQNGQKE